MDPSNIIQQVQITSNACVSELLLFIVLYFLIGDYSQGCGWRLETELGAGTMVLTIRINNIAGGAGSEVINCDLKASTAAYHLMYLGMTNDPITVSDKRIWWPPGGLLFNEQWGE